MILYDCTGHNFSTRTDEKLKGAPVTIHLLKHVRMDSSLQSGVLEDKCVCVCVCVCVYTCVCMHLIVRTCMCVCVYACVHACIHTA